MKRSVLTPKPHKPKTCDKRRGGCGVSFVPVKMGQRPCSPLCAISMVNHKKAKEAQAAKVLDSRQDRIKKEALKTIPDLKNEAQHAFNKFIRTRDQASKQRCICCGASLEWDSGRGGSVDAGHYRSTGSADHLRYSEDNCHAQRTICNRYGAGRAVDYRIGLIARIGLLRVEALESNNEVHKWTREELREIRDRYRQKAKKLERNAQQ